ncbi:MAG: DUF3244 domain-containing protein [Bacteroides sp.]|nr:DUF3244 domain-containing protein [Bacteroides sp.]
MQRIKKNYFLCIVFLFNVGILNTSAISSLNFLEIVHISTFLGTTDEEIILEEDEDGKWLYRRSLIQNLPKAFLHSSYLSIYDLPLNTTVRITIKNNNGGILYEQEVLKTTTFPFEILLDHFSDGNYILELRNPLGGYLYGYFTLYSMDY